MANTFAPNGLQPIRRLDGAAWTGNQTKRPVLSSAGAIFRGDPVIALSTGYITQGAAAELTSGTNIIGVFNGCYYQASAVGYQRWSNSWPGSGASASTDVQAFVIDDPNVVFEIQSSVTSGAVLASDVFANANLVSSSGNALSGFSQWSLGAVVASAQAPLTIVGLSQGVGPGNDNASAFNKVEVAWNNAFIRNSSRTGI